MNVLRCPLFCPVLPGNVHYSQSSTPLTIPGMAIATTENVGPSTCAQVVSERCRPNSGISARAHPSEHLCGLCPQYISRAARDGGRAVDDGASGVIEIDGKYGIRRVTSPDIWLVSPWPKDADVHEVVQRFLGADPTYRHLDDVDRIAFYVGYLKALELADKKDLTTDFRRDWYRELYECVEECVTVLRGGQTARHP